MPVASGNLGKEARVVECSEHVLLISSVLWSGLWCMLCAMLWRLTKVGRGEGGFNREAGLKIPPVDFQESSIFVRLQRAACSRQCITTSGVRDSVKNRYQCVRVLSHPCLNGGKLYAWVSQLEEDGHCIDMYLSSYDVISLPASGSRRNWRKRVRKSVQCREQQSRTRVH